jgi:hypothetical protein
MHALYTTYSRPFAGQPARASRAASPWIGACQSLRGEVVGENLRNVPDPAPLVPVRDPSPWQTKRRRWEGEHVDFERRHDRDRLEQWGRFPPEVIAVRWYLRLKLSYQDIEELLLGSGIEVDHVTVYRWVRRFTPLLADAARFSRHPAGDGWHVDKAYVGLPSSVRSCPNSTVRFPPNSTCTPDRSAEPRPEAVHLDQRPPTQSSTDWPHIFNEFPTQDNGGSSMSR